MGSGTVDVSSRPESQTAIPGAIHGLRNLKRKMAAIDLEREAFKVDQASLNEEVSTMTISLEKMANNIIAVRQDMTKMSARFRSDIADLKQLIIYMSANKRGRKQSKQSEGSSTSSAEKIADKSMETYDDIVHEPHGPTCANLKEKATLQIKIMFRKAIVHPARARLGITYVCLTHHG
jgi:hypothetical protein